MTLTHWILIAIWAELIVIIGYLIELKISKRRTMAEFKEFEVIMRLSPKVGYSPKDGICVAAEKVAELVRCKDCVNFHKYGFKLEYTECKHFDCDVCEDGFCAWGERKEVKENEINRRRRTFK